MAKKSKKPKKVTLKDNLGYRTFLEPVHFKEGYGEPAEKCFFIGNDHFNLKRAKRLKKFVSECIKWMEKK